MAIDAGPTVIAAASAGGSSWTSTSSLSWQGEEVAEDSLFQITSAASVTWAGTVQGIIEFDNASVDVDNLTSFNFTIGDYPNRYLLVFTAQEDTANGPDNVTSVTYNSVAMTQGPEVEIGNVRVECWYMLEADLPVAGTYAIVPDFAGGWKMIGACSLYNCKQQAPEASATDTDTDGTSTLSITTLSDHSWVVDGAICESDHFNFTAGSGQIERYDAFTTGSDTSGTSSACTTKPITVAGTTNMTLDSDSGTGNIAHVAVAIAPVEASAAREFDSAATATLTMIGESDATSEFDSNTAANLELVGNLVGAVEEGTVALIAVSDLSLTGEAIAEADLNIIAAAEASFNFPLETEADFQMGATARFNWKSKPTRDLGGWKKQLKTTIQEEEELVNLLKDLLIFLEGLE